VCFDFSTNLSEKFLIIRRIQRDIFTNILRYLRKVPVFVVSVLIKLEFSKNIFEKSTNT